MSKETQKKATFDDIIKKQLHKKQKLAQTFQMSVEGIDGYLEFLYPSDLVATDFMNRLTEVSKEGDSIVSIFPELIYNCCPQLQDKELRDALGVIDPFDVVKALFTAQEIMKVGGELNSFIDGEVETTIEGTASEAIKN